MADIQPEALPTCPAACQERGKQIIRLMGKPDPAAKGRRTPVPGKNMETSEPQTLADAGTALLAVEDVTLCYTTTEQIVTATYRVNFQVASGDRFILLGPSG